MIPVYYSPKDTPYVMASDLREELAIKTELSKWFPRMIEYGFEENKDYSRQDTFVESANNMKKQRFDWAVTVEMAKHIAMIQRTPSGKALRDHLLNLDQKVSEGEYLNQHQIKALFEICKVIGYFSVQDHFEQEHYAKFIKERGTNWWDERARLFGYTAAELKEAMKEIGVKYVNQRQALFHHDKYELIRIGVTELFVVMGKSKAYAKNVGNIAKDMSKELKSEIYNDINTSIDFKTDSQNKIITDLKDYATHSILLSHFKKGDQRPKVQPDYNQQKLFGSGNKELDDAMSKALNKK